MKGKYTTCFAAMMLLGLFGLAETKETSVPLQNYSPYADRNFPENLYWGDTHLHSRHSFDASFQGNLLTPDAAYRYAKGETVMAHTGEPWRIARPLDFLVLSDHSEYMGILYGVQQEDERILASELGKRWKAFNDAGNKQNIMQDFVRAVNRGEKLPVSEKLLHTSWQDAIDAAERHNKPGSFTAFIGYEWTSSTIGNLHRNIVFRDDASLASQVLPLSSVDSSDPEKLWQWLAAYENKTGGRVLAIPHNGNLSNGAMFPDKTFSGKALSRRYAETRARWEPLYEVTQMKGDGEAHPYLSPDDGFADFETWDYGSLSSPVIPKEPWMLKHEYARSALKLGLKKEQELGANPFKFGLIGSTDSHTSLSSASEDNFYGKFANEAPTSPERLKSHFKITDKLPLPGVIAQAASGYAAVWAHENTRESIFDAMQRRETYASTGPRIVLRFFGGWDFKQDAASRPDYVRIGYHQGVPMGGDLINVPEGEAPEFLIVASKDPQGANLDRIQVVKGWLDSDGLLQEKVYDVALSDGRKVNRPGKVKPLKHTVDLKTATYTNSIGEAQLATVWSDPDFNPEARAFYYVRVLEIPTPRWSTYDAAYFNEPLSKEVPAIIQERAYSSPIWYTP